MWVKFNRNELHNVLDYCIENIDPKNTILNHFLFKFSEASEIAEVYSFNLEQGAVGSVEIQGRFQNLPNLCLPAKELLKIVKALNKEFVVFQLLDNNRILITETENEQEREIIYEIPYLQGEDYYDIPEFDFENNPNSFDYDASLFANCLAKVVKFTSRAHDRFVLDGVCFDFNKNRLVLVASDGHRLSKQEIHFVREHTYEPRQLIVPHSFVSQMIDLAKNGLRMIIGYTETFFYAKVNEVLIFTRLIEGQYPDYEAVIPKPNNDRSVIFQREELLKALNQVKLVYSEKFCPVIFTLKDHWAFLQSSETEIGKAQIKVPYYGNLSFSSSVENIPFQITFNANYLIEALNVMNSEEVRFDFGEDNKLPVLLTGFRDENFLYVIMPMTLK